MRLPLVDVAVSIVRSADGRVLLAERTARQVAAGFWEFPGGKIDAGETAEQAATRELEEEIGITPERLLRWRIYEHAFRTKRVRLHFFRVERWQGDPHGREGQRLAWVDPAAPGVGPLLPSNERAILALGLPPVVAVTNVAGAGGMQAFLTRLHDALGRGLRLIQVREPRLAPDQLAAFARQVARLAEAFDARVLLAGSALQARRSGVAGVHSSAVELRRISARPQVALWSASCHSEEDLARAAALGADFAVVSPVLATASHADLAPLGWDGLQRLAASAPIALYAQGGMRPEFAQRAREAGAAGVAVSSGVWDSASPSVPPAGRNADTPS